MSSVAENITGLALVALLLFWLCVPYEPWLGPRIKRLHDGAGSGARVPLSRKTMQRLYGWLTAASALAGLVFWHWAFLALFAAFFHLWTAMASDEGRSRREQGDRGD